MAYINQPILYGIYPIQHCNMLFQRADIQHVCQIHNMHLAGADIYPRLLPLSSSPRRLRGWEQLHDSHTGWSSTWWWSWSWTWWCWWWRSWSKCWHVVFTAAPGGCDGSSNKAGEPNCLKSPSSIQSQRFLHIQFKIVNSSSPRLLKNEYFIQLWSLEGGAIRPCHQCHRKWQYITFIHITVPISQNRLSWIQVSSMSSKLTIYIVLKNFYPHHRSNLTIGFMNIIFKLDLSLEKRNPLLDGLPTTPAAQNLFISSKIKSL